MLSTTARTGVSGQSNINNLKPFFIVILLLVLSIITFITIDASASHAVPKHMTDADIVHQCLDSSGPTMLVEERGGIGRICFTDSGKYGIQWLRNIDGKWKESTAYIKNKFSSMDQLLNYLKNQGCRILWNKVNLPNEAPLPPELIEFTEIGG